MQRLRSASIIALLAAGCAGQVEYIYAPKGATDWADARPITTTAIPQEAPEGEVQLSSFGITQLTPDGANPVEALHVRMTIANTADPTPWTVDPGKILLDRAQEGRSRALFVNTDVDTLPTVTIARSERKTLDLYFPVPSNAADEALLPAFDVLWEVTTEARPIAGRTSFRAVAMSEPSAPPSTEVVLVSGWGSRWWFNHAPAHVIVTRQPRWHYHPKARPHVRDQRR